jgi:uncharacterized membrane protein YkvA (DUF1232 family)
MRAIKAIAYAAGLIAATVYLLNPTAGVFELLPDNLPIVGHIDEAAAVGIFITALRGLRRLRAAPQEPSQ